MLTPAVAIQQSVTGALALLGQGQVLAACAGMLAANVLCLAIVPRGPVGAQHHRLTLGAAAAALVAGLSLSLLLSYILPVALTGAAPTPLGLLLSKLGAIIQVGLLAAAIGLGASLAPGLGRLLGPSPGAQLFLSGLIAFRFLSQDRAQELSIEPHLARAGGVDPYPGLIVSLGFLLLAWLLAQGIERLLRLVAGGESGDLGLAARLAPALGVVGGLLALLIYCAYVRVALAGTSLP